MAPDKPDPSNMDSVDNNNVTKAMTMDEIKIEKGWVAKEDEASYENNSEEDVASATDGSLEKNLHADDDLTSLAWLHQQNILKSLEIPDSKKNIKKENVLNNNVCEESADYSENTNSVSSFDDNYSTEREEKRSVSPLPTRQASFQNYRSFSQSTSDDQKSKSYNTSPDSHSKISSSSDNLVVVPSRNKHPANVPYDPVLHKDTKPPYSFSSLIFMAIEDSVDKALLVKEVYAWITAHFPYYQNAPAGWKNSVRHNLSLNKCFHKLEKCQTLGKGCLWMVDSQYRPNLLQAIARVPCLPAAAAAAARRTIAHEKPRNLKRNHQAMNHIPDPSLFPFLSKRLALKLPEDDEITGVDSDVDAAATTMMSLKHGSSLGKTASDYEPVAATTTASKRYEPAAAATSFAQKHGPIILKHNRANRKKKTHDSERLVPVITRNANEDHTYSCITAIAIENPMKRMPLFDSCEEDVDELRKTEGADALLNLAGVNTNNGPNELLVRSEVLLNLAGVDTDTGRRNEPLSRPDNLQKKRKRPIGDDHLSTIGKKSKRLRSNGGGGGGASSVKKVRG